MGSLGSKYTAVKYPGVPHIWPPGFSLSEYCDQPSFLPQLLGTPRKHFLRNCTHCYLDIIEHLFYNMDTRTLEHLFANIQAPFRSQPTGASGGDADGAHNTAL